MNRFTFFPLAPFSFKYLGLLTALVGLALLLFLNPGYDVLVYAGLFIVVFSKERKETDETRRIRNELFKSVFGLLIAVIIALYLTELISSSFEVVLTPFISVGAPLILYLILFYLTLLLRIRVDSSQDVAQNIRLHRRFYLIWLVVTLVAGILIILRTAGLI